MNKRSNILFLNWHPPFLLGIVIAYFAISVRFLPAAEKVDSEKAIRKIADNVLKDANFNFIDQESGKRYSSTADAPPGARLVPESRYNDWRYWNGVLNIAMLRLGEVLKEPTYTEFAVRNVAFSFDNYAYFEKRYANENKWEYPFGQFFMMEELDDCGAMGASVIEIMRLDPQERYLKYIDRAATHILTHQSRLEDGTLVRTFPRKYTLWADDLYMANSFLCRMGKVTERSWQTVGIDDATRQVINFHKYLFDQEMGLMYHNWYSDTGSPGVAFWGRANGWAILAQVELLDQLPADYPQRDTLLALFRCHIDGIVPYQDSTGLWHQLLDKPDSFPETSCTAMFTYAIARAVNQGYLESRYKSFALKGWQGILTKIRPDGQVEGICTGTSTSDDLSDYYTRPTPLNDGHGIGTVLMAGTEIIQLLE
ncbi:MAG TPA: glycoside hydrolase family 88 protein [Candidatus Marinimicrobia bacterium]|nr:glycoside hydrolase family 88 protein [Candidatus Neomarinimicrobiota bacterium]